MVASVFLVLSIVAGQPVSGMVTLTLRGVRCFNLCMWLTGSKPEEGYRATTGTVSPAASQVMEETP